MSEVAVPHLHVHNLVAGYVRGLPVVHDVSIEVARGEIVRSSAPTAPGRAPC